MAFQDLLHEARIQNCGQSTPGYGRAKKEMRAYLIINDNSI